MLFNEVNAFVTTQFLKNLSDSLSALSKQDLVPVLRYEYDVIFAIPLRMC